MKAQRAVLEMRGRPLGGCRLQTDYASHECRTAFFERRRQNKEQKQQQQQQHQEQKQGDDKEDKRYESFFFQLPAEVVLITQSETRPVTFSIPPLSPIFYSGPDVSTFSKRVKGEKFPPFLLSLHQVVN